MEPLFCFPQGFPKDYQYPKTAGGSLENDVYIPKILVMYVYYHLRGVSYKLLVLIVRKKQNKEY